MALRNNWLFPQGAQVQRCPDCDESIESNAINIKEGVALCPSCGKLSHLAELNFSVRSVREILREPPAGCSLEPRVHGVIASASLRSFAGFLASAGIALFWNGIVSVFVLLAMAGLYTNLIGPLPAWFPAPGMNAGKPEMNGAPMELGMTLFLCVFLTPFVTVGIGVVGVSLMNLVGKVEVVVDGLDSYVATGVGFAKWKRRFDPSRVRAVDYGTTSWQSEGKSQKLIELRADRTIKFGSLLQEDRMEWLRVVLKELLLKSDGNRYGSALSSLTELSRKP